MPTPLPPPPPSPPDPIVEERVAEANLEPTSPSRAVVVTLAVGGAFTLGFGVSDATGRGGGGSLRVARKMAKRWYLDVEVATGTALHEHGGSTYINTASGALVGVQYYVNPAFWIRGGIGAGSYAQQEVLVSATKYDDRMLPGPVFVGGAGIELAHWRHVGLDLELRTLALPDRIGFVMSSGVELGLEIY